MDFATGIGLIAGGIVLVTLILMGGDLRMFADTHAAIVIFGGSFAATLIRFPLSSIFHGLPLGAKFAFTMRRITQRDLVDELAALAEVARKQGPIGLEKVEIEDPFLAKGIRFVADGYDNEFIRDNLERDRDNFLTHLDEGQQIYRAVGDCAPAFGMIGTLIGMVQMFANMTDPSKLGSAPTWRSRCWRPSTAPRSPICSACRSPTSCTSSWWTRRSIAPSSSTAC